MLPNGAPSRRQSKRRSCPKDSYFGTRSEIFGMKADASGIELPDLRDQGGAWKCPERDSNPHPLRDQILSLARLPIPPSGRGLAGHAYLYPLERNDANVSSTESRPRPLESRQFPKLSGKGRNGPPDRYPRRTRRILLPATHRRGQRHQQPRHFPPAGGATWRAFPGPVWRKPGWLRNPPG